jgi:glycosyltransferase involved in cell wall biosynthesis
MSILWTIGILHLPTKRAECYTKLVNELNRQIALCGAQEKIEILTESDNGENSVGKKRNNVIDKARGEYVCFIDDDDMVTDIYISETLKALQTKPDVVELVGFLPKYDLPFIHNLNCGGHFKKDGTQFRTPNHLNTVKTEIARKVRYPEISHGEDQDYSHRLWDSGLLKTEALVGKRMYIYQFDSSKSETVKFMRKNK